jgi:NADH-quinone oxidoreductase subunit J
MNAQFLALVNIVVYAGAIMVLFLFVVMFLNLNRESESKKPILLWLASVICAGSILLMILGAIQKSSVKELDPNGNFSIGLIENIGEVLYRDYLLPLELSSVLFLVAMIGVVLLNRREKTNKVKFQLP